MLVETNVRLLKRPSSRYDLVLNRAPIPFPLYFTASNKVRRQQNHDSQRHQKRRQKRINVFGIIVFLIIQKLMYFLLFLWSVGPLFLLQLPHLEAKEIRV